MHNFKEIMQMCAKNFARNKKNTPETVSPLGIIKKSINLMGTPASGKRLEG